MDAQELRNLQEAYMEVVSNQLDEVLDTPQKSQSYAAKNAASAVGAFVRGDTKTLSKRFEGAKRGMKKIEKRKEQREEYDLYDIILSHLLDEGYAETYEAAEKIMVNMSEEWRESIFEAMVNPFEQKPSHRRGEPPTISPIQRAQNTVRKLQTIDPNSPKTRRVARQINDIERLYGFARNAPGARR